MLPKPAIAGLKRQLAYAYSLWSADRANGVPDVYLPDRDGHKIPASRRELAVVLGIPVSRLVDGSSSADPAQVSPV
jgi:hypothetical protein